jgi:hypothetical protein
MGLWMLLEPAFGVPGVSLPLALAAGEPIHMRLVHCRVVLEEHVHVQCIGCSSGKWRGGPTGRVCW